MSGSKEMVFEKRMEKRRRRRKTKTMFFLVLLFFICLLIFALYSPMFNISGFEIYGMNKLKKQEIISSSGIEIGQNIFKFSAMQAKKKVSALPYAKEAVIIRKFPNIIQIYVKERVPIAVVSYLGSYILIDKEGIALEVEPNITNKKIIEIKDVKINQFTLGKPISEKSLDNLNAALNVLTLLQKDDLLLQIDYINIDSNPEYPNQVSMNIDKKYKVILGDKTALNSTGECKYRIDLLKSILKSDLGDQAGVIDLTIEKPTFRPYSGGEQQ